MKKLFYLFVFIIIAGNCYGDVVFISENIAYDNGIGEDNRMYIFKEVVNDDFRDSIEDIDGVYACYKNNKYNLSIYKTPFYSWKEIQDKIIEEYKNKYQKNRECSIGDYNYREYYDWIDGDLVFCHEYCLNGDNNRFCYYAFGWIKQ